MLLKKCKYQNNTYYLNKLSIIYNIKKYIQQIIHIHCILNITYNTNISYLKVHLANNLY